jgi:subtilisin-like proprotein convertase family protein
VIRLERQGHGVVVNLRDAELRDRGSGDRRMRLMSAYGRRPPAIVAAIAILMGWLSPSSADAATRTYFQSNISQISVPGPSETASPYPSTIDVGLRRAKIKDVNVTLNNFGHGEPYRVHILLVAPNGRNVVLMSGAGSGADVTNINLTLDDEAAAPLSNGALTSGAFKPTDLDGEFPAPAPTRSALSIFDGSSPAGQWQLFVATIPGSETGQLAGGWTLQLQVRVR